MQKIMPCLWFNDNAEEAVAFYRKVFKRSKIKSITRYGDSSANVSGQAKGSVMTIVFEIEGQRFMALNGGPIFTFSPAISLIVECDTQKEIDHLWSKLSADPESEQCGWLKDKFGISWQINPKFVAKIMTGRNKAAAERVMKAILRMKKIDINALKQAAKG